MHFNEEVVENVAESIITIITKYFIPLGEFLIFKFLITYNECLALIQVATWYLKRECYLFNLLCDFLVNLASFLFFMGRYIIGYFLHSYTEPLYMNWVCVVEMGKVIDIENTLSNSSTLFFVEEYAKLNMAYEPNDFNIAMYFFEKKYMQQLVDNAKKESLVMMKLHGDYIVRIASKDIQNTDIGVSGINAFKQSSVEFLSILYSHPSTLKLIEIRLPRGIYKVGNQLLSISHVWRCVAYSSIFSNKIQFDDTYRLHIIDHNAMRFEIGSDDYLVIEEDNYKIMKHQK